jgi:hypothetical protein
MTAKFGAILYSRWEADPNTDSKNIILGRWSEDNTPYSITVPYQIRDQILELQNTMYDRYHEIERLENELAAQKAALNRIF